MRVTKKAFIGKSIAICCLILLVVFMCLLKTDTSISEWWTGILHVPSYGWAAI